MVNSFCAEIIKEGQRSFICVPFNVWDKCERKGNIPIKVTVDNFTYECKLVPKGNGIYFIPIKKGDLNKIGVNEKHEISFELISGLCRINNNSPYSLGRPIRQIDSIKIIIQPRNGLCGQSCVAMLSGVPLNEIVNLIGSQCSISKVIEALDYFGIAHSDKMVYSLKQDTKLPKCCIINSKGHLMVFYEGKCYDPSSGILDEFDPGKITGFLEIFL